MPGGLCTQCVLLRLYLWGKGEFLYRIFFNYILLTTFMFLIYDKAER